MSEECVHGMNPDWCGICKEVVDAGLSRVGSYAFHGGQTKQDVLNDICDLLEIPREPVNRGSSVPSGVFAAAARRAGVSSGSMPATCEAIVRKAGLAWSDDFDSRATRSQGGSTVTFDGMRAMRDALRRLLRPTE